MAGIKRKESPGGVKLNGKSSKKVKTAAPTVKAAPKSKKSVKPPVDEVESESDELDESASDGFAGLSAEEDGAHASDDVHVMGVDEDGDSKAKGTKAQFQPGQKTVGPNGATSSTNSKEAHAKQKALAKERKASKPNADSIARSKKLWERLRRKSHVPKEERDQLVEELFGIITGRVQEFVFKHDSVRVIQCALKYSNADQRKSIAAELKGHYRALAEQKYAKFMLAKMVVEGDAETRSNIVSEFYGHVRRLINHPEAAWILDDIYRNVATPEQKALLLREWYGPEFSLLRSNKQEKPTAVLSEILAQSPEKRKPIMDYLRQLINQLIQKKLVGFTMLHDAMLQYFLNTRPGTEEATEFSELIKGEEEGDLLKNLAFTKSGSRLVCLTLAYGTPKDRKQILKVYKDVISDMAYDTHAHLVLLTAFDVIDDTVLSTKTIYPGLLGKEGEAQTEAILNLAVHLTGRVSLLYPFAGQARWLLSAQEVELLKEVHGIRESTSKKDPETRRQELIRYCSVSLLSTIAAQAATLVQTSYGCQFITEVLMDAQGDKSAALEAVADTASGDPTSEEHISRSSHASRMLKTLVQGGRFDAKTNTIKPIDPPLNFHNVLYGRIKSHILDWACGSSSFVVVALLEADGFDKKEEVKKTLKKEKKRLQKAATEETEEQKARREAPEAEQADGDEPKKSKKEKKSKGPVDRPVGNMGSKLLLEKL